ncbi:MAG: M50 family metallopeptidase [Clostridia bacterium]
MAFSLIVTVLAFGIMVMLHEAGHFFMARRFGVTVHEFSIGMGPLLFKWGKGETQYSLRLLPLGGYVKLESENDESDNPKAFSNVSPVKRICVLLAGAFMNVLLGFLCFVIINNIYGYAEIPLVSEVIENSPAQQSGIMAGDCIIKLDGKNVGTQSDVRLHMLDKKETVEVTFIREGEKHKVTLKPLLGENGQMFIGFKGSVKKLTFLESFKYSYYDTRYVVKAVFYSLKMLLTGGAKISDMSGPVGIIQVVDQTTEAVGDLGIMYIFINLLNIFAMISVNLGVFNLLPIPGLDGGSIIFNLIEVVTRKKQKPEILGYINLIGLALLLGLGVLVMISDIIKLI